jgi:hypothetical protein
VNIFKFIIAENNPMSRDFSKPPKKNKKKSAMVLASADWFFF